MMTRRWVWRALTGLVTGLVVLGIALALPGFLATLDARGSDLALSAATRLRPAPAPDAPHVALIDIDRDSLARVGPWPWRRDRVAALITRALEAGALAVGVDILFDTPDARSPAALARRLGDLTGAPDLIALADRLPDDDRTLADSLAGRPVALGFVLGSAGDGAPRGVPLLRRGPVRLSGLWGADGATGPTPALAAAAAGLGTLALPGDPDGVTRNLPLLVVIGGAPRPGLVPEVLRLAQKAQVYRLDGASGTLAIGGLVANLGTSAMLRLVPAGALPPPVRLSAADLLEGDGPWPQLAGAVVFIGGTAPELGGLRATADQPLTASVEIAAAAATQLMAGWTPVPPSGPAGDPRLMRTGAVAVAIPLALLLPPLAGALAFVALALGLVAATVLAAANGVLLATGSALPLGVLAFVVTATLAYAEDHRRARSIRRRFEQHLSPAVVARIARDPALVKLSGERREVSALFTDIAGFTSLTHRAGPEQLVAILDSYFEGVTGIIIAHGGMIDKFVGDAVHAFFNAPLDQPGHAEAAVRCAIAIADWTERYRQEPLPASFGLGLTRIGVETGSVVIGDIGIANKLDYTAHGDAVNAAARLEAANKELGTRICIGPAAAALCPPGLLRPGGRVQLRGFDAPVETFEPVPTGPPVTGGTAGRQGDR